MASTATNLLNQVKVQAGWPSSGGYLTDAEVLSLADDEMLTTVASLLRKAREEYWVTTAADVAVSDASAKVRIPSRALGSALRDVLITKDTTVWSAPEVSSEDAWRYQDGSTGLWNSPFGFYCESSHIVLLPTPTNSDYSVRFRYYRRPSELIEASTTASGVTTHHVGVVASVSTNVVTLVNAPPSTFSTAETFDIIDGLSPHDAISDDLTISSLDSSAKTMTFSADVDSSVKAGDYIALAGKSPVVQIPTAIVPVLVLATMRAMHQSSGDLQAAASAEQQLGRKMAAVLQLIEPRVIGERPVVINRTSALRGGGGRGW